MPCNPTEYRKLTNAHGLILDKRCADCNFLRNGNNCMLARSFNWNEKWTACGKFEKAERKAKK